MFDHTYVVTRSNRNEVVGQFEMAGAVEGLAQA